MFRENNFSILLINNLNNFLNCFIKFMHQYYFIIIGFYFLHNALITAIYANTGVDYKAYLFVLAFVSFTVSPDIKNNVKLIPFLCCAIPFLLFIQYISGSPGYSFWGKLLSWQISKVIVIDLNPIFSKIPYNDGGIFRIYKSETLTWFLRLVYNNGFVLPVLVPIYRAAISKDFGKMLKYALSAHIFQVFLITPFYLVFHLQEVWYVLGQPDRLGRNLSPIQAASVTLNCFPSMHTSIAFAMFLLVLREKNKAFKFIWGFFCLSVIFSTLYLEVHWVLDVVGGMVLAYGTVKLVDYIMDKSKELLHNLLKEIYYKDSDSLQLKL